MKVTGSTIQQLEKDKPKSRCRKWRLWATTEDGRKSRRVNGTYSQACDALSAFVDELEGFVPNSDTVGAYAASWLLWREKSGDYSPGTLANCSQVVRMASESPIGGARMDAVTPADCRDALMWMRENPVRGRELSGTTMNKVHVYLNAIFQQAADDGVIAANPMARIKAPKVDTKEKEALSPEELMLLVNRFSELPLDGRVMALYLIALLGLRRAEACALLDADVRGGMAHVHLAVKERDGSVDEPKSPAGVRTLPMPAPLVAKVREWRELKRRLGWRDAPTLCVNTHGGMVRPQLLQRWWSGDGSHRGVRDAIGCHGMTLHQLRHSNLSMMARHMSPFDLQRWAGWSSIAPARVYVHGDLDAVSRAVSDAWDCIGAASCAPNLHHLGKRPEA